MYPRYAAPYGQINGWMLDGWAGVEDGWALFISTAFLGSLLSSTTPAGPLAVAKCTVREEKTRGCTQRHNSASSAHKITQPSMWLVMDWPLLEVIHISGMKMCNAAMVEGGGGGAKKLKTKFGGGGCHSAELLPDSWQKVLCFFWSNGAPNNLGGFEIDVWTAPQRWWNATEVCLCVFVCRERVRERKKKQLSQHLNCLL